MIKTWIADYPRMHGRNENEVSFVYAGLVTPRFVILDLEGGTRRLITLSCGAFGGGGEFSCQRASYDLFKVGHREPPQQ